LVALNLATRAAVSVALAVSVAFSLVATGASLAVTLRGRAVADAARASATRASA
jgi:hypothetical protein